jgi:hypothetical protein
MTPSEIINRARTRYNAVGDNFFSDNELLDGIYEASMEMAIETECIEKRFSSNTVVGQREYEFPSAMIRIDRITYDGQRLDSIDFVEDDVITRNDEATTFTGTPKYYTLYNSTLFLRPTPSEVKELVIFCVCEPSEVTLVTTLDLPVRYHIALIDALLSSMFAKDGNNQMAMYHQNKWQNSINRAKRWEMKRLVSDRYKNSKAEEFAPYHLEF